MNEPQSPAAFRTRLLDATLPALRADARIRGCWEGGSVATGRADDYSDIDLCLVGDAAHHAGILDDFDTVLQAAAPIAHVWRIDPPQFPGVTQRIYLLAEAPPYFAVDCAVLTPAGSEQFLEKERHGEPVVYFDRDAAIAARSLDPARHEARLRQRLEQIRGAWPVYRSLVAKELARGRALDAIGFYSAASCDH